MEPGAQGSLLLEVDLRDGDAVLHAKDVYGVGGQALGERAAAARSALPGRPAGASLKVGDRDHGPSTPLQP